VGHLNPKDSKKIRTLLQKELPMEKWDSAWKELGFGDRMPDILKRKAENTRLFLDEMQSVLGIDGWKAITDYLPRLAKDLESINANGWKHAAKMHGDGKIPKELSFFGENERTSEVVAMALEEDLLKVIDTYIEKAFRKRHFQPVVDEAQEWLKAHQKVRSPKDAFAVDSMEIYFQELTGARLTEDLVSTKNMFEAGIGDAEKFLRKHQATLGMEKEEVDAFIKGAKKMYGSASGLMISNLMSFRAWLPLRNSFQPFFTLGPIYGNGEVAQAYKVVANNWDDLVKVFEGTGRSGPRKNLQQVVRTNEDAAYLIERYNQIGMSAFDASDTATRLVAAQVVKKRVDDHIGAFQAGSISQKQFMEYTGIDRLYKPEQMEVLEAFNNGGYGEGLKKLSDHMTEITMFTYRPTDNPRMFKGILGKMFGAFGTYPIHMTELMLRFARGPKKYWPATAARLGMWFMGTRAIFQETFGIDPSAFDIWSNIGFSGGPQYQLAMTALKAVGGTDWEKAQAKLALPNMFTQLYLPGYRLGKTYVKLQEAIEEDNYGKVVRTLLTAPEVRD
jgi:hypothetical protein